MFIDSTANNRVYIVGSTTDTVFQYNTVTNSISAITDVFNTANNARVQGNLAVQNNAYVDGALTVQGNVTSTGTGIFGGLSSGGTTTLATSTSSQTIALGAGATLSGSTKTLNIGTAGASGSITNINIGSAVSGATSNTLLYSNTFVVTGGNTHLGGLIGGESFRVIPTVNSNNYLQVAGAVTGSGPILSAQGVDTNIGIGICRGRSRSVCVHIRIRIIRSRSRGRSVRILINVRCCTRLNVIICIYIRVCICTVDNRIDVVIIRSSTCRGVIIVISFAGVLPLISVPNIVIVLPS